MAQVITTQAMMLPCWLSWGSRLGSPKSGGVGGAVGDSVGVVVVVVAVAMMGGLEGQ